MQVTGWMWMRSPFLLTSQRQEALIELRLWFRQPPQLPLVVAQGGSWPTKGPGIGRETRAGAQGDRKLVWRQVLGLGGNNFSLEV